MPSDLKSILRLEVPVIVRLAERELAVGQVVRWVPGSIIELQKPFDDELDLMVNNVAIGRGVAVKVGENFGLKVNFVGDLKSKIQAFGGRADGEGWPGVAKQADPEAAQLAERLAPASVPGQEGTSQR